MTVRARTSWLTVCAVALAFDAGAAGLPKNLIDGAIVTASSSASAVDGKYGLERLRDGDLGTHWASAGRRPLPEWIRVEWAEPVTFDTVVINGFWTQAANIYAAWKAFEVELSDGTTVRRERGPAEAEFVVVRLDRARDVSWARVSVLSVHEPKVYVGIDELGFYLDPTHIIGPPKQVVKPKGQAELEPQGRPEHPTVYVTSEDVRRAHRNAAQTEWGKTEKAAILERAQEWLEHDEEHWLQFLPPPGACYAYGFTGCPICGSPTGTWGGARCRWDLPRKVTCLKGHVLPDEEHPDDGAGYVAKDGRIHYFIGSWNAWVTEKWTRNALIPLAYAYSLTGDERYAERAAFFIDALASIYAESTSGSWDYPSRPPSGRFARPWYQTARNLVVFVEGYDLIYSSPALDKPSLRPRQEKTFPTWPLLQERAVGRKGSKGRSWEGMTRRENVDTNLMRDSAHYCYKQTFKGALHNGHADYMRGALAVGALLGIPEYVRHSVESPFSIYAMLANNCDRDGRYYETALGYALHARNLYLTFVEPLKNWRSERYPNGVDLFADSRMRSFFHLPALVMQCAGHRPNFGDAGPDNRFALQETVPFSTTDYLYAERLYAGCTGDEKGQFGQILGFLAKGNVPRARAASRVRRWLLYHGEPAAGAGAGLDPDLERRIFGSWFLGQKGIAILRDGRETDAQAALLRYGPSLNHGDYDDLGLVYYAKGWQMTYEIGYGLASTHSQTGWASQTVAHTLVTVNEKTQRGLGTGGSLHLFASLPSIKIMEADSPLSYASEDVTQYRRTVVLVGSGRAQYLIDVFRVRGGRQHDYGIGVQSQDVQVTGLELGPEEEGSLAGTEHAWGERIGLDGDVKGYPNRPYWNPPPKNGYGFFYEARRGRSDRPFSVDFGLGGRNDAHFRVHALPEPDTEAILAKAPGLYPRNRKATFLVARRKADGDRGLSSVFASVMEPYAAAIRNEGIPSHELPRLLVEHQGEVKPIGSLDIFLLKGGRPGDFMTFEVSVEGDGDYEVAARILRAPSYGTVRLLVDGEPAGEPFDATYEAVNGPIRASFGKRRLLKGAHRFRFEMQKGLGYYVGVSSLIVQPWEQRPEATSFEPKPVLSSAERVPVTAETRGDVAPLGVHVRRGDTNEYFLSAGPDGGIRRAMTAAGDVTWRGAAVFIACRNGAPRTVAGHGAWDVTVDGKRYGPAKGVWEGKVVSLSYDERWVEVDTALPEDARPAGVYFSNPEYSRNTAYRIYGAKPTPQGTRIDLGAQPMLLGQGRVHDITLDGDILSDIPHDYARPRIGASNSRFFDGKLVTNGRGASTHLKAMLYGLPMKLKVESVGGFAEGDKLFYYDVQVGDDVVVPTAWEVASE